MTHSFPTRRSSDLGPFECSRCGKPFGGRKSIERIADQLAGKHSMFRESGQIDRIKMCEDCRITDQFTSGDNPFQFGERPVLRTTDYDLRTRELERARALATGKPPHTGCGCRTLIPSPQTILPALVPPTT